MKEIIKEKTGDGKRKVSRALESVFTGLLIGCVVIAYSNILKTLEKFAVIADNSIKNYILNYLNR